MLTIYQFEFQQREEPRKQKSKELRIRKKKELRLQKMEDLQKSWFLKWFSGSPHAMPLCSRYLHSPHQICHK